MKSIQEKLFDKENLDQSEAKAIFDQLIKGQLTDIEMTSLLVSLKMKVEQPEEIAGAAQALRENAVNFEETEYLTADSCGTGGSGMNTVNVSTMVAFVLAELGLPMVKHGNRSISSKCGSADVLENLGVKIDMNSKQAKDCLDDTRFCFLFAPIYHPGVGNVMPIRNQLKTRTIFNLLGPLVNPAFPKYQLMGIYSEHLCQVAAETLKLSGCKAAMVVHSNGYDEITLHSPTKVVELCNGNIDSYSIDHSDFSLPACQEIDISGDTPEVNAALFIDVLRGDLLLPKQEAIAHTVAANAAALLKISGRVSSLSDGAKLAMNTLKSGQAFSRLEKVIEFSDTINTAEKQQNESSEGNLNE